MEMMPGKFENVMTILREYSGRKFSGTERQLRCLIGVFSWMVGLAIKRRNAWVSLKEYREAKECSALGMSLDPIPPFMACGRQLQFPERNITLNSLRSVKKMSARVEVMQEILGALV